MIKSSTNNNVCVLIADDPLKYKIPTAFLHGRVIGKYADASIYDKITDNHGQVWQYEGVTNNPSYCKLGVIIVKPGIVYKISA